ncbi:MAG: monophosphatase [Alphaproteobacteria bacterium]|nr:monophosphatase [Alphaproteobacteria bacterium]
MPDAEPSRPTSELAVRLTAAVRDAGDVALKTFRGPVKQWIKGKSSPVCEADIAVDQLLRERLATPGYAWLSEEAEDDPARLAAGKVWIVDPIDGTRAYLAGQPDWTISVALASGGRPILAALFAPVTEELFLATAGGGATRNGVRIAASSGDGLDGARAAGPKRFLNWLAGLEPRVVAMPRIGSLALRIARVAHGALDAVYAGGASHDWDLAAADLLVHEAGGALTTLTGDSVTYNQPDPVHKPLVAAGIGRHAALIRLVRDRASEFA